VRRTSRMRWGWTLHLFTRFVSPSTYVLTSICTSRYTYPSQERRQNPPATTIPRSTPHQQPASMLLVGAVANRTAILIDDLADTSNTITRAAKLLKKSGAATVYALVTHGVFSGDAVERIWASALDKVVVTNSVPQEEHVRRMEELARSEGRRDGEGNVMGGKLEVLEVGGVFAEAIRRVHHGESISVLFQYD